jgi:hypothetical protein
MNSTMNIVSVKQVPGPMRMDGGTFEITAEVDNGFLKEEVTWSYSPGYKGHEERLDTDCAMNNPMGYLLLGLLREFLTRENPITSKMMKEVEEACDEMEDLLG